MRLPDPQALRTEFQQRGFVLVSGLFEERELAALSEAAFALVQRHATTIDRADDEKRLWYAVVAGDRVRAEAPALFSFYVHPDLLSWVRALTACPSLAPSPHLRSAINVNCLRSAGQQYPWHRDAVPYTALLFLSSVPPSAGGALLIRAADGDLVEVEPAAGRLVFMDGARCPHRVAPLAEDALRLTVPMVYPLYAADRPSGLDEYLYDG